MPKKIIKIIREREQLIDNIPGYFIKKLEKIQNRIYRELLTTVKGMDVTKNKLDNSALNIKIVNRSRLEVARWLRDSGYYEAITDFGNQYKTLIDKADSYYGEMDFNDGFLKRDLETLSKIKKNDLDFLINRDKDVINTTYDELMNSVYHKSDWRDLAERLKTIHTDTVFDNGKQLNGLLKKYAATYANTAYAAFDRRIQNIKAAQYGLKKYLFSGSLIMDSRDFCKEKVGKIFTAKEIEAWQDMTWRGKAAGRDVWIFLGGFNCRHILSPVTDEMAKQLGEQKNKQEKKELKKPETIDKQFQKLGIEKSNHKVTNTQVLNIVAKQLDDFKNQYEFHYTMLSYEGREGAYASSTTKILSFNEKYFDNPKMFKESLAKNVKSGYHPRGCDSIESVITHEFAHSLTINIIDTIKGHGSYIIKGQYIPDENNKILIKFRSIKNKYTRSLNKIKRELYKLKRDFDQYGNPAFKHETIDYKGKQVNRIKLLDKLNLEIDELKNKLDNIFISDYAKKNLHEFVAESFAMYKHADKISPFAKQIGEIIDEIFKK